MMDRFSHIKFPAYKYQEYPKYMGLNPDNTPILAHDAAEEKAFTQELAEEVYSEPVKPKKTLHPRKIPRELREATDLAAELPA